MPAMNRRVSLEAANVLKISEVAIPEPPAGGAIVKVMFAGICHTDVQTVRTGYNPMFVFPRVLGHEISGVVYRLGKDTAEVRPELKVGDNVCVYPWGKCQECTNCRADYPLCTTMHYGKGPGDPYVYGIWKDGGYQNYVRVDLVKFLEKVPDHVPMDAAATLMCGGVTSYNAISTLEESILRSKRLNGCALVVLVGAGGLALWAIQIIKALYPEGVKVTAVDINDDKLIDAQAAGADMIHKWGTTESAQVAADCLVKTCGARPDCVIDYVGLAPVIERGYLALNLGGTLTLVGLGGNEMPNITLNSIIRRNVSIKGSVVGSQQQCRQLIQLVHEGKVRPPMFTHVKLEDLSDILDKLHDGKQRGRAVVKM